MKKHILLLVAMVVLALGGTAYANDQEQQLVFEQPILIANTSFLNIRTGPSANFTVLVTVVGGTELPVLGLSEDRVWYLVATDGGPGWVNVSFTIPRGNFSNVPFVEPGEALVVLDPTQLGIGGGSLPTNTPINQANFLPNASIPTGTFTTGVTLLGKDLHIAPSYDSLIISRSVPNDPFTIYPLLGATQDDAGNTWYNVNIPGIGNGWMDAVNFRPLECGTDQVGVVAVETPINFDGIANREPFLLPAGTEGYILGFDGANVGVYRFQLLDGTVGFVASSDVVDRSDDIVSLCDTVPSSVVNTLGQGGGAVPITVPGDPAGISTGSTVVIPQSIGNRVIVNTSFLNIRSGPSANFSVLATVNGGTELALIGRAPDNVWYLVEGEFGQGWINNQFVIFRGNFATVPVIRDTIIIPFLPNVTDANTINLGVGGGALPVSDVSSGRQVTGVSLLGKDLHQGPSYDSLIISRSVPNDPSTIYPLLQQAVDDGGTLWYRVDIPGIGNGWMDAVELRLLECGTDQVGVINGDQPINFDGIANREPFLLPGGTEGYINGQRNNSIIFELLDGTVGLVDANAVTRRTGVTSVCTGVPAAVSTVNTVPGAVVPSLGQGGGALPVVNVPPTAAVVPTTNFNRVIINTGNLNIRSGPSAIFSVVATVPGGTELLVLGRAPDNVWYLVEGIFGQGWINSQFAIFRGNFSTVPVIDVFVN